MFIALNVFYRIRIFLPIRPWYSRYNYIPRHPVLLLSRLRLNHNSLPAHLAPYLAYTHLPSRSPTNCVAYPRWLYRRGGLVWKSKPQYDVTDLTPPSLHCAVYNFWTKYLNNYKFLQNKKKNEENMICLFCNFLPVKVFSEFFWGLEWFARKNNVKLQTIACLINPYQPTSSI